MSAILNPFRSGAFKLAGTIVITLLLLLSCTAQAQEEPFVHPGIDMTQADLNYMKEQVLAGKQPWLGAYERLKEATRIDTEIAPVTHIIQGPYNVPDIGGTTLRNDSEAVYSCAVLWYISGEEIYAQRAIEIIEKWSGRVWSFEDNNAKLLGGMCCYPLCSGAEILRYNYSGWNDGHTEMFSRMLMETFYPLLRFYFPEANGNWDGMILRSIIAMAVFMDNRELFDSAIDHYLYAPANGSVFKYIYPSGQSQETSRDLGHVQMGLAEFAGTARIAYTQGVDLFATGNYRLAMGWEYTMDIMLGGWPQSYGKISTRAINSRRDDYEYLYRHYRAIGVDMPLLGQMCDTVRGRARRGVLTAFRKEFATAPEPVSYTVLRPEPIAWPAGAKDSAEAVISVNDIEVLPGENLQEALDKAAGTGYTVVAKAGVHNLSQTLTIPSGTRLVGEGIETVLVSGTSVQYYAITSVDETMHDVYIGNLVIEGASTHELPSDPNTGRFNRSHRHSLRLTGIAFMGKEQAGMKNIVLENVTVINFSRNGVFITGADNVQVINCDFSDNGSFIVPGPRLQHNMLMKYVSNFRISDSRFDTSMSGCGIALDNCAAGTVERCEIARNAWFGVLMSTSDNITVSGCLVEGNDGSGVMCEYLYRGCHDITVDRNIIRCNNGDGVEAYSAGNITLNGNLYELNKRSETNIDPQPRIILEEL